MEFLPRLSFQFSIVGILRKHNDPIIVIKDKYVINLLTKKQYTHLVNDLFPFIKMFGLIAYLRIIQI